MMKSIKMLAPLSSKEIDLVARFLIALGQDAREDYQNLSGTTLIEMGASIMGLAETKRSVENRGNQTDYFNR